MDKSALTDAVAQQYQQWVYPEPITDLPSWSTHNWQWFDPSHAHLLFWPDRDYKPDLDILIAGCGTNQAAVFAYSNPGAKVVAIDVSEASLAHQRFLKERYGLNNLELHRLAIEEVGSLGLNFDLIVSTGVLHHLASPETGLRALAAQLRPDGVAALMLYASCGRIGVEMLQGVFRDLGLAQDEPSLAVVRAAVDQLPQDHPLRSYMTIAPDLNYDAGLVDTFLHGRDRSFTVSDCLELVASAELVFQEWFFKTYYYPPVGSSDPFHTAVAALPDEHQWAIMERINHRNACHYFTVCRPERLRETYRVDFTADTWLDHVPVWRYRCGFQNGDIFRSDWKTPLNALQQALISELDGRRTLRKILAAAGPKCPGQSEAQLELFGRTFFQSLWQRDFIALKFSA